MKRLTVLVYPHTTEIGGSQLNAIELAGAVRDRGHEVVVYSADGPLVDRVRELGLEHLTARRSRIRPGPSTAADLNGLVRSRGIDVVHGYEWPPILEAYAACQASRRAVAVGTVMSMSVAPFIPSSLPLTVGTARIQRKVRLTRRGEVHLLEPPVDTRYNCPDAGPNSFRTLFPADGGTAQVVVVSRLVRELKLEGILTAVQAVGALARSRPVRLVIVGNGNAYESVAAAARRVNADLGKETVVLTGELSDPRGAYDAADVCLGMGGSALRSLAFAKPLIVQGESGFFEVLTPETADLFLDQGWYGTSSLGSQAAVDRLTALLAELLDNPELRAELGSFGRRLVEDRFSLDRAAAAQEDVYLKALRAGSPLGRPLLESLVAGVSLVDYKVRRRVDRLRGQLALDDFNARPL